MLFTHALEACRVEGTAESSFGCETKRIWCIRLGWGHLHVFHEDAERAFDEWLFERSVRYEDDSSFGLQHAPHFA